MRSAPAAFCLCADASHGDLEAAFEFSCQQGQNQKAALIDTDLVLNFTRRWRVEVQWAGMLASRVPGQRA